MKDYMSLEIYQKNTDNGKMELCDFKITEYDDQDAAVWLSEEMPDLDKAECGLYEKRVYVLSNIQGEFEDFDKDLYMRRRLKVSRTETTLDTETK